MLTISDCFYDNVQCLQNRAKPRMSAVAGRRTYTEEELQAALRDIQSGKLGTRRAAVIYGIPRSTLRNKVYKLAMEKERDSHLVVPAIEEKDLSGGEEEKEVERALRRPLLSMEDLVRFSMLDGDALRALLEEAAAGQNRESGSSSPLPAFSNAGDLWRGLEHSALGPYISQLLASTVQGDSTKSEGGESLPKFPSPLLPELVRRMMAEEQHQKNKKQTGGNLESRVLVNGTSSEDNIKTDDTGISAKLTVPPSLIEVQMVSANSTDGGTEVDETLDPDTAASTSNVATPPNVILKIPSFKPTTKNGVSPSGSGCLASSDLPFQSVGGPAFPGQESSHTFSSSNNSGSESCSPPVANLTGKGIGVSLRDVIAKSISQKFQLQGELPLSQKLLLSADEQPLFKRGRFTPPPSVIKHNNNNSHVDDKNKQTANNTKNNVISSNNSGKGTRPKRGKYRNYDRDSLVEAVRAVQRGEMSVHRAGSYYGVPHSTLEYKVKERHLMRPRKREPKQQLEDNRRKEDVGPTPLRSSGVPTINCDKLKLSPKPSKSPFTQPLPGAPNGLKIPPLFDPGLSPLAAYTNPAAPFSFWTPNPFHPLALPDLGGTAPGGFPPSPEQFFATQLLHRLPEESRGMPTARNPVAGVPVLGKSAREMAESLYDGTGANGSFLDGIIRSSLEMGLPPTGSPKEGSTGMGNSGKMSNKALIDQLCRNSCFPPLPKAPITSASQDSRMESNEQCADEESVKVLSPSDKTVEADTIVSAVVDLSQSSNGLPDSDSRVVNDNGATKCCVEETSVSKDTATLSPMANTKGLPTPNEEPRLLSNEVNSLHDKNVCTPTDDESACDSKTITKIGDIEVAKDLNEEGDETADPKIEEDTKSKMINS